MKRIVEKPERVALCRRCHGTGRRVAGDSGEPPQANMNDHVTTCPQCEGSGRVIVSCKMELDIKPYP